MKKNRRIGKVDAVWLGKLHSLMKHGYTVAEAAEHMNVSEGAVNKYYRILRKIENRVPVEEKSNYCKRAVREYCQMHHLKAFEEITRKDCEQSKCSCESEETRQGKKLLQIRFCDGAVTLYDPADVVFVSKELEETSFDLHKLICEAGIGKTLVFVSKIQTIAFVED